jgi:hypothetical protein
MCFALACFGFLVLVASDTCYLAHVIATRPTPSRQQLEKQAMLHGLPVPCHALLLCPGMQFFCICILYFRLWHLVGCYCCRCMPQLAGLPVLVCDCKLSLTRMHVAPWVYELHIRGAGVVLRSRLEYIRRVGGLLLRWWGRAGGLLPRW